MKINNFTNQLKTNNMKTQTKEKLFKFYFLDKKGNILMYVNSYLFSKKDAIDYAKLLFATSSMNDLYKVKSKLAY